MGEEKNKDEAKQNVWLKEKQEVEVAGHKFKIRGLTLRETLKLTDILSKIMFKCFDIASDEGDIKHDVATELFAQSVEQIDRVEEVLCVIIEKPKGYLHEQDPVFFSGLLEAVINSTDLKAVKENFTKMAKTVGITRDDFGPLSAMLPK